MVMHRLVRFPTPEGRYRATGSRRGMYVMLAAPDRSYSQEDAEGFHHCHPDTAIQLTRPNLMVSPDPELWESEEVWDSAFRQEREVEKLVEAQGRDDLSQWLNSASHASDYSVPVLGAVHLGSTQEVLWNQETDTYWQATVDDLTGPGLALYEQMGYAYGSPPLLLTFLGG